jgi:RHS repeat-associated protein
MGTYRIAAWGYYPPPVVEMLSTNLYFAGRLINSGGKWVATDRLGSVVKSESERLRYFPWGEEQVTTTQRREKFATYVRDTTGLDYADQRYYSSQHGRFLTADPYVAPSALGSPQSWNRYAYVHGDPVNFYDPTGNNEADPNTPTSGPGVGWGMGWTVVYGPEGPVAVPVIPAPTPTPAPAPPGSTGGTPAEKAEAEPSQIARVGQAPERLNRQIQAMPSQCLEAMDIESREALTSSANSLRYWDGRPSEGGNAQITPILGPSIDVRPGATFNSESYGTYAVILPYQPGGTLIFSPNVVLGTNFWGQTAADQGITLAHELMHSHLQKGDPKLAKDYADYQGDDKREGSERFSAWLKRKCP